MKVLFVNVSSIGHVAPTFNLVHHLSRAEAQVVYLEVEEHRAELEACGARFLPLQPFSMTGRPRGRQIAALPAILAHSAVEATGSVLETIASERPDVVVHDSLCLWGRLAADIAGVRRVASIASAALSRRMLSEDPIARRWAEAAGRTDSLDTHFERSWRLIQDRYGCQPDDKVGSVLNPAPVNIVHLSRSLQPQGHEFADDYVFCGSGQPIRHMRQDFNWPLVGERRLVFMSFGTAHDPGHSFYARVAEAMRSVDAALVAVASPSMAEAGGIDWPAGTVVCTNGTAPQIELLARADLFIGHVGGGAVREAAWTATPILGLPQTFEQDLFCHHLAELGVAIRLGDDPTTTEIASAIATMLGDDRYRTSARTLSAAQRIASAPTLAVDTILGEVKPCA
jgi:MGT family glycosyltransferase